ncbi:hypothetical protein COOONC_25562 [Cooperia oncophora]
MEESEALKDADRASNNTPIAELEVLVVAEASKHWRTNDPRRERLEQVTRAAVGTVEEGVAELKGACEKWAKEQLSCRQLRASLECNTQLEFVEAIESLVEKAAVVDKILSITKWAQEEVVSNCAQLKKKMARLIQKEDEVVALQAQLKAKEEELDELRGREKEMRREALPGREPDTKVKHKLESLRRLKLDLNPDVNASQNGRKQWHSSNRWILQEWIHPQGRSR